MAQARKAKLNYRCPQCFMRDIDMDMFYDPDKKEYYCLRCSFHGNEELVLEKNEEVRLKYGDYLRRFEMKDFENFDD